MKIILPLVVSLLLLSAAARAETPTPTPKLVAPITTIESHQGIVDDVSVGPLQSLPLHQHAGDEFLYVITGSVHLFEDGRAVRTLKAGDAYRIPAGTVHSPEAGEQGARAIVFRVHPTGEPITVPTVKVSDENKPLE